MKPSKDPLKRDKHDAGVVPPGTSRRSRNVIPTPASGRSPGRIGRQAYTLHIVRHDRQHHKPGR